MSDFQDIGCNEYNALSRRQFLSGAGKAALIASLVPAWMPRVAFAKSYNSSRDIIVSVYLRGGCDGLSIVPPFGDAAYYTLRPNLGIPRPDSTAPLKAINLNGFFGFAPAMSPLMDAFDNGNLAVIQATGSTDPTRSHFDAQKFMEVGTPSNPSLFTGWLGRHLATTSELLSGAPIRALGYSAGLPRTLAGAPKALPIPNPASFTLSGTSSTATARMNWLNTAYSAVADPVKSAALNTQGTISLLQQLQLGTYVPSGGAVYANNTFATAMKNTAALIKAEAGIEAAHIDLGGWDTHSNQGPLSGGMATLMNQFAGALASFHQDLYGTTQFKNVTLVVVSEFGRVAKENASLGTDHGHGNMMMVMGSNVNGQVYANWPGLSNSQLYQGQDLAVTTDHRDILAEIVAKRLGNQANIGTIFPGYSPTFRNIVSA